MFRFVWQLCKTSKLPKPTISLGVDTKVLIPRIANGILNDCCKVRIQGGWYGKPWATHLSKCPSSGREREKLQLGFFLKKFNIWGYSRYWFDLIFANDSKLISKIGLPVWSVGCWGIKWCTSLDKDVSWNRSKSSDHDIFGKLETYFLSCSHQPADTVETSASVFVHFPFFHCIHVFASYNQFFKFPSPIIPLHSVPCHQAISIPRRRWIFCEVTRPTEITNPWSLLRWK